MPKPGLIFVGCRTKMEYLFICAEMQGYKIVGVLDSHYYENQDSILGVPFLGDERWLLDPKNQLAQQWLEKCVFFPANHWDGVQTTKDAADLQALRKKRIDILEHCGAKVVALMYPGLYQDIMQSRYCNARFGKGVYVGPGVTISPHNVMIDDYCVFYDHAKIDANTKIGKNVFVCSNSYLYDCEIGNDSYFGMNASIRVEPKLWSHVGNRDHKIHIGCNSTIWATAVVNRDVPDNSIFTHTGKILKKRCI